MKCLALQIFEEHKKDTIKEYFGEEIEIDKWNRDYILENLNTHDPNLLVKKLEQKLPVTSYELEDRGDVIIYCNKKITGELEEEFKRILDFYGYYETLNIWTEKGFKYYICPKYSKNCSDFIYHDCCGICYHICETNDVDSILRNGLRCRVGGRNVKKYREFPKRIYVIAVPVKEMSKAREIIRDVVIELGIGINSLDKYNVLKINKTRQGHNHGAGPDFYQDDAMKNSNTFFTYTNIPPQEIKDLGSLKEFLRQ